ncbi:MAG: ABC transporter substrate-binding protein [Marmoricola sp.]
MGDRDRSTVVPVRSALIAALAIVVAATLAGCGGSAIDAKTAARAQAAARAQTSGNGQAAGNDGTGTVPGATNDPAATTGDTASNGNVPAGTGATGSTGGSSTGSSSTGGGSGTPPAGVKPAVSCTGLKNGNGITSDTIRIGNSSDITGPVPGLFTQAQQATRAYVNYFNSTGARICGRKLALDLYDSRTDAGADQQQYSKGCATDFAMVGSMSSFDSGGAKTAQDCGIPDIRAISTTNERAACSTCFGAQPAGPEAFENAVPDFIKRQTGGQKAAMLYINIGAAAANGMSQAKHEAERGLKFVVTKGIDVAEFNYAPYVTQMKAAGVTSVQFIAASPQFARMAQAMDQGDFHPKVYLLDPSAYNDEYPKLAGSSAKGTDVFLNFVPFEEASTNREMRLYLQYLQQASPGAKPGFFGVFAWSATRLFVQEAQRLGGSLTRQSLVSAMRKVDSWTSNGIHAPEHVGSKKIADCWRFIQWSGSAWKPIEGKAYQCRGITSS